MSDPRGDHYYYFVCFQNTTEGQILIRTATKTPILEITGYGNRQHCCSSLSWLVYARILMVSYPLWKNSCQTKLGFSALETDHFYCMNQPAARWVYKSCLNLLAQAADDSAKRTNARCRTCLRRRLGEIEWAVIRVVSYVL